MRQPRCSGPGTKLKINSPARNRRRNRSASRMARLRPLGARLEKAGARGKRRYRSHSLHTGFPYGAVDSLIASFSSRSRRQADKRRKSLLTVPKRRRSHSPGERIASPSLEPTTTLSTFLGMSIEATLFSSAPVSSWRGSGRTRGKIHYAPSRATTLPAGRGGATKIGSKPAFRVNLPRGLDLSRAQATFTVPRRIHNTMSAQADFHPHWWAEGPCSTQHDRYGDSRPYGWAEGLCDTQVRLLCGCLTVQPEKNGGPC